LPILDFEKIQFEKRKRKIIGNKFYALTYHYQIFINYKTQRKKSLKKEGFKN
jgi:hypothetical protein